MLRSFAFALTLLAPGLAFAQTCPVGQNASTIPSCEVGHVVLKSAFPTPDAVCFTVMETGHVYGIDDAAPGARALEFGVTILGNQPGAFVSAVDTALCGPPIKDAAGNWVPAKLLQGINAE